MGKAILEAAAATTTETSPTHSALATQLNSTVSGLSGEQYQELLAFLNKLKGPTERLSGMTLLNDEINWIMDTGASRHMTRQCGIL